MQDTTTVTGQVWNLVSNNALISTLVAAVIVSLATWLRSPLVRAAKWVSRFVAQQIRRAVDGARRLGRGNDPPAVDVTPYIKARDEARQELQAWKREALDARHAMKYGEPLPEFGALSEIRHEDVVTRVSEMIPTTRLVLRYCHEVWTSLVPRYKEGEPDSAVRDLIVFLEREARYPLNNTASALYEYLQGRQDPRPFLVCFYKRYREWRDWVHKVGKYLGTDARRVASYADWRKYDDKWREELEQKVESPNLSAVRSILIAYNQQHGDMVTMPEPDAPYAGPTQQGPGYRG